jgi:hypothetical protein
MEMAVVKILMEMPPPKPRRSGDVDGVDFPFVGRCSRICPLPE